ncbi:HNH endonuclease [Anabaena cylindrica UHCC 0172]|uniref:HNH endonuclease n=1 Tax=Anabaena cylindrica TaxID=1165 RepID=UPI002B20BCAF|nr:HNH endonuclease [Anabaena cylindrica]MEA5553301.1 HNH endonuclease [Anabaena cylindrica UHCC 0172]
MSDYPKHWKELAQSIKEKADWRCQKCGRVCLRPGEIPADNIKPRAYNLQVHHHNMIPTDNRVENLIPVCASCHLNYHRGGRGNVVEGQLSLFDVSAFS